MSEINIGGQTGEVAEEHAVTLIGNISQQDIEDGTVLVFSINVDRIPQEQVQQIVEQLQHAVSDTFEGKIKAMIVPNFIEVQTIKNILKDATKGREE